VHDDANVMRATGRLLGVENNVDCAAHTLQLCVNEALKSADDFGIVIAKSGKIVMHCNHSNVATMALTNKQVQLGMKEERLVQSCPTRWDSVYHMCDVLFRNRAPVCAVLGDRAFTSSAKALSLEISEQGWGIMEDLIKMLKPLHVAIKLLCSDSKVTISAVRPVVGTLITNHNAPESEDGNLISTFKTNIVAILKRRFHFNGTSLSEDDSVLPQQVASFLNPRYKDLDAESRDDIAKVHAFVSDKIAEA